MGKLTGTLFGDAANDLLAFYEDQAQRLEESGAYFMAAIALGFALETALLAYMLVEFGEDNGGELEIPGSVSLSELIEAAREVDVLSAPIEVPPELAGDVGPPKHIANDVVDTMRKFRNLIHPARTLKAGFSPSNFTAEQLQGFKDMYQSVTYGLLCNL